VLLSIIPFSPSSTLFPYTTLFRSDGQLFPKSYTKAKVKANLAGSVKRLGVEGLDLAQLHCVPTDVLKAGDLLAWMEDFQQEGLKIGRAHAELQSRENLVCRLLLEK